MGKINVPDKIMFESQKKRRKYTFIYTFMHESRPDRKYKMQHKIQEQIWGKEMFTYISI